MRKVLVYGSYDIDNLGDDYMMLQVDKKLKDNDIQPIYIDSKNKKKYFNREEVNYHPENPFIINKNKIIKLLKTIKWVFKKKDIKDIDSLIFMGGGYTNESFSLPHLFKMYFYTLKFKRSKKKIYFTGQTVGPAKSKLGKIILKKIYKNGDKVFVREKYSKELLDNYKIESKLVGDDAFLVLGNNKFKDNPEKEYIIFNYKDFDGYDNYKNEYFKFLLEVAKKKKKKVKVIPFRSLKTSDEYKINYELYKYLKGKNIDVEFCVEKDIEKFNEIFRKSEMVIGTAYHSIVLGLVFDNDVYSSYLGNYYKMKIDGILDWYGYNDNCFNLEEISKDKFSDNVNINSANHKEQKKITNKIVKNVVGAWDEIISDIRK